MILFNELPDSEKARLMKGDFGTRLLQLMFHTTAALYWRDPNTGVPGSSGSAFFTRTNKAVFGVTAKHVFEAYERARQAGSAISSIDNLDVDLLPRLISKGSELDVATFEISPSELKRLEKLTIPWTQSVQPKGTFVMVTGFPSMGKRVNESGGVNFGLYYTGTHITSVSDRGISMLREPDSAVTHIAGKGLPPRGVDLGGMSGGPVVAILESAGIVSWALAGVVYESNQSFEIIQAVRADLIAENGTILG